ncbi:hypothetical protein C8R46DRAFT_1343804 [Mycena filopes]|nr:hypothetical protein C8R46DRAFT_1343804 [Mycena filopes]
MSASTGPSSANSPAHRGSGFIYGIAFGAFGALLLVVFILGLARQYIRKHRRGAAMDTRAVEVSQVPPNTGPSPNTSQPNPLRASNLSSPAHIPSEGDTTQGDIVVESRV